MHMIILWYAYTEDWCVRFYLKAVSPLDGLASMTKIKSSFASFHFNTCLTLWLLRNTTKWSDNIQAVNGNTQQTNGGGKEQNSSAPKIQSWQPDCWGFFLATFSMDRHSGFFYIWSLSSSKCQMEAVIESPLPQIHCSSAHRLNGWGPKYKLVGIHSQHFRWLKSTSQRKTPHLGK